MILWQRIAAYAVIYFVWGSTFLAIRVGVREVPPYLYAALRFLAAGAILFGYSLARGVSMPAPRQWRSISILAFLIFVLDYGSLFWAEQRVPSGIAALLLATIPVLMVLAETLILRTQRLTLKKSLALAIGFAGVAVLVFDAPSLGGQPIDRTGAAALFLAALAWAASSALTRKLPLPDSKPMSSGAQMLTGGAFLLLVSAALGEPAQFHFPAISANAWLALFWLTVPGSVIGFTAYLWLLDHDSALRVGTYAYVNPVVAVALGALVGGEPLGLRTLVATALILVSVLAINFNSSQR